MTDPSFLNPDLQHVVIERHGEGTGRGICPSITEIAPGRLLLVYHRTLGVDFHGRYGAWLRESGDGGTSWSDPRLVAEDIQAPGLLRLPTGELLLNGCLHHGESGGSSSTTMRLFRSGDNGASWIEQSPIWERSDGMYLQGGCGNLIRLACSRILCPLHGAGGDNYHSSFEAWTYFSDDDGHSWQSGTGKIALPKRGAMEPCVAELPDSLLVVAMRTQLGSVYISQSSDEGDTWADAWPGGFDAPEAPLAMTNIPDSDTLVLVYCAAAYEPEHHHCGDRTPLAVVTSSDSGKTWKAVGSIAGGEHEFGASGPNSICFTSDGRVIFAYNWIATPWARDPKTGGGINLAIAEASWLQE
jgi:sialidase-1